MIKLLAPDLVRLIETPKENAAETLAGLGGIEGVAASLDVQLDTGLDTHNASDLAKREQMFGKNYVEPEKPSTILQLMWQAFEVFICTIVSTYNTTFIFTCVCMTLGSHYSYSCSLGYSLVDSWIYKWA